MKRATKRRGHAPPLVHIQFYFFIFYRNTDCRNRMLKAVNNGLGNGVFQLPLNRPAKIPGAVGRRIGFLYQQLTQ